MFGLGVSELLIILMLVVMVGVPLMLVYALIRYMARRP
jgi:heme/copper-type cytochrome/quinol oxidase subunit 2